MTSASNPGRVRPATAADAATIAAIYGESVADGGATFDTVAPPAEAYAALIGRSDVVTLVACIDETVVGWGRIKPWSDRKGYATTGEVSTFISRPHLRAGHGLRLKQALIEAAAGAGYHHLVSRCFSHNAGSIALNLRVGFEVVGVQRQVGWLDGRWIDVTILQRIIEQGQPPGGLRSEPRR